MWIRLWVCKSDVQVWSLEVEVSRRVGEMLRELSVLRALSMIQAGRLSIYGDRAGPGWPISTLSGAEWALAGLAGRDAGPGWGGAAGGWKSDGVSEVSEGIRAWVTGALLHPGDNPPRGGALCREFTGCALSAPPCPPPAGRAGSGSPAAVAPRLHNRTAGRARSPSAGPGRVPTPAGAAGTRAPRGSWFMLAWTEFFWEEACLSAPPRVATG